MPSLVEDFAAAQAAEYAAFVAVETILVDGVRAYNVGDPVPASNVDAHGYLQAGLVRKKADDPAPELTAPEPPPAPVGDPVVIGDTTTTKKG
jgi:hypothetical protein